MNRLMGAALLLAAFAAMPATEAYGQKKNKKNDPKPDAMAVDSATLPAGEYHGALKSVPGTDRVFNVDVETTYSTGNSAQRIAQLQLQIQQEQARLAAARTASARNTHARNIARHQQQLQQAINSAAKNVKTKKTLVAFQTTEKVKVRTMVLPEAFDDKGNPKTYTAKEKSELKGKGTDRSLPGYESSLEKLEVGQTVSVKLVTVPKKKPTPPKDSAKDGATEKPADDTDTEKTKQVRLIVITKEASGTAPTTKPGKKK